MERIHHPVADGGAHGADRRCTRFPEVFQMHVPPVIRMRDKERSDHPELSHARQLIRADQLGMDHHRADVLPGLFRGIGVDHLLRRGIPIAVRQNLHVVLQRLPHIRTHFLVRVYGVAAIPVGRIRIRLAHPGGAPLRGTIQKDFIAADFQAVMILLAILRVFQSDLPVVRQIRIGNYIQFQALLPGKAVQERPLRFLCKSVLRGGNPVLQVDVLCLLHLVHLLLQRRLRDALVNAVSSK